MNKCSLLVCVASLLVAVDASPFLFNAIMTFSHMNLSEPLTGNIADLRNAKSEHLSKSAPSEYNIDDGESQNEATPGVFQKTVTKILQKLQFLAQLANPGAHDTNANITVEEDGGGEKFEPVVMSGNSTEEVGRFSLAKVFESVVDLVSKMG